ncbi:Hypothetical protein, putative [Bodo saltans]|uniref:Uncharacterized protein n=1 Tax=Bodo saltans TaxID=75058 RepID=A0A0S4JMS8_BODSA|nr:Hypothetical protein, putative [Bodo saltans]|eukprot:CUG92831.1 Hypothetical protein, putative [Bodo saltans]
MFLIVLNCRKGAVTRRMNTLSSSDKDADCQVEVVLVGGVGVGGRARANPYFCLRLDRIRISDADDDAQRCRNIPLHWYDGGNGWATKYFYDSVPRCDTLQEAGRYRCQVRMGDGRQCDHEIVEGDCCKGTCLWTSKANAHFLMANHAINHHGAQPPPRRQWSTSLLETEGCWDALLCAPCQGSRQMMAMAGWEDRMHWGWAAYFCSLSSVPLNVGIAQSVVPPCVYVALGTRTELAALNNIDEHWLATLLISLFLCPCSIAQSHRELVISGVAPGSGVMSKGQRSHAQCAMR